MALNVILGACVYLLQHWNVCLNLIQSNPETLLKSLPDASR